MVLLGVYLAKVEEIVFVVIVQTTFVPDDISLFLHVQSSLLVPVFIFVFQLTQEFLAWMTVKSSSCLLVDLTNGCSKQYHQARISPPPHSIKKKKVSKKQTKSKHNNNKTQAR